MFCRLKHKGRTCYYYLRGLSRDLSSWPWSCRFTVLSTRIDVCWFRWRCSRDRIPFIHRVQTGRFPRLCLINKIGLQTDAHTHAHTHAQIHADRCGGVLTVLQAYLVSGLVENRCVCACVCVPACACVCVCLGHRGGGASAT